MGFDGIYPVVNIQKAMENGPVEIVDFPINSMVIFHCYVKLPEGINIPNDNWGAKRSYFS